MAMMGLIAREDIGLAVLPRIVVKDEIAGSVLVEGDHLPGDHGDLPLYDDEVSVPPNPI
jgi:hypothetical protein